LNLRTAKGFFKSSLRDLREPDEAAVRAENPPPVIDLSQNKSDCPCSLACCHPNVNSPTIEEGNGFFIIKKWGSDGRRADLSACFLFFLSFSSLPHRVVSCRVVSCRVVSCRAVPCRVVSLLNSYSLSVRWAHSTRTLVLL
jgi:hypothetical protein